MVRKGTRSSELAVGQESMTQAPYLLPGARAGYRAGDQTVVDSMMYDGLTDAFDHEAMGLSTEHHNENGPRIGRARQDAFAAASHERAAGAAKEGRLADEIVPVNVPSRKGDIVVEADEGIRPETTVESLGALKPAFTKDGTITAGNASQISDGGAAVVVMSPAAAARLGAEPIGEVVGYGQVAGPDNSLLTQPSRAILASLSRSGTRVEDLAVIEINEAFATVALASIDDLGLDEERVNPNGGAIALGHPVGMSGTRIALTLLLELRRRGGGLGVASLCGGGGQGDALLVRSR
jgi:acetyl-CoA C-acetyltransferase